MKEIKIDTILGIEDRKYKIYSYCRVSTIQESLERQEEAIKTYCEKNNIEIDRAFADKISGKNFNRNEYLEMKKLVNDNDVIIIKELDRFGRSMDLIKEEWEYFMKKGVRIIVIDMPLISSDLDGNKTLDMRFISNLVFEVLCYSVEKEREKISQRTKEALAVKKTNGVVLGRPAKFDANDIDAMIELRKNGYTYKEIGEVFETSAPAVQYILKKRVKIW